MGQDTYCVLGAGAPIKFTYENLPIYQKIFNSIASSEKVYILLLNVNSVTDDTDSCHDISYNFCEIFETFEDKLLTNIQFQEISNILTLELHKYKLLPVDKHIIGIELQIHWEINCCHVRNISRRKNPYIFNNDYGWTPNGIVAKTQSVVSNLVNVGIPENQIYVHDYIWDSS